MKLETFTHAHGSGWSVATFPPLDSERTLVVVFGGSRYAKDRAALEELSRAYPSSTLVGCSSAGEIHGHEVTDDSLSVAVVRFDRTKLRVTSVAVDGASSATPGEALGRALAAPDLRAVFVLSDGISVNGTALLQGIHRAVAEGVVVTGGLAGDGTRFEKTWVLSDREPVAGVITAVGLYGDAIQVTHGSRGGWDAFGPERIVTKSEGNVVYELDGGPALALYKTYLGERAAGLPATALLFPLALRTDTAEDKALVRTILAVDEATQSMTFAGDVPQEATVQLMRANFERLIEGAGVAGRSAAAPESGASLAIAISCVGRRIVLGERSEEEVEAAVEGVPPGSKLVGFYSYGEISPFAPGQCGVLHNQTMTLTRIWEQ